MKRTPNPWSHSALEDYKNCPKQFYERRVIKSVKQTDTEEMLWGTRVHTAFEERQRDKTPLPEELEQHEEFMQTMESWPGAFTVENRIGFSKSGGVCTWEDDAIWSRNVIDYRKVAGDRAKVVDYKTGKEHAKMEQLGLYALHTFLEYPAVMGVTSMYYWTKTRTTTQKTWGRMDTSKLWGMFLPHLIRYKNSFETDTWPARPSGLCNGWCPVMTCEHWRPKRPRY